MYAACTSFGLTLLPAQRVKLLGTKIEALP